MAIYLLVIGIITLRASPNGARLHRIFIALKLPLALLAGVIWAFAWIEYAGAPSGRQASHGMLVLFGQASGPVGPFDPQLLNQKGSLFLTRPNLAHYTLTREELVARANDVLSWVARGELQLSIDRQLALPDAAEAHRLLESRATTGKLLLIPGG